MSDHVADLENRPPPAFVDGKTSKRRGPKDAAATSGRLIHTTVALSAELRSALRREAMRRAELGDARRPDASEVLRDCLEFWRAHEAQVSAWLKTRRKTATRE